MSDQMTPDLETKFMVDPYLNWVKRENALIHSGEALDLLALDVKDWPRFGMKGAVCHVDGRCDFLTAFLFELAAGAQSTPMRHVHEEAIYVLSGSGETEITLSSGHKEVIQWGAKQVFAIPVNATARHKAGASLARFVALSDFRYLMGLYRNEAFLFGNSSPMHGRQKQALEAGLVGDPATMDAAHDAFVPMSLADMSVGVDVALVAPRASGLARRQMQGRHILGVEGAGFTLSFSSETSEMRRIDWRHGILAGLKGMQFHQHFDEGATPARFISVELGSQSSPMFRSRRAAYGDDSVYASGAAVIPREKQRPDIPPLAG